MWKFERGSWQYDVMCALIVAFIVFTPRSFFQGTSDRSRVLLDRTDAVRPADVGAPPAPEMDKGTADGGRQPGTGDAK